MTSVFAALIAGAWIGAAADPVLLLRQAEPWLLARWATGWLLTGNAFALGLIFLLAGLRHGSVRASRRRRRGVLVKLIAANVLLICMAVAMLQDAGALDTLVERYWPLALAALAAFVLAARWGFRTLRSGWKYDAPTAGEILAADPRPPVVYLRPFDADAQVLPATRGAARLTGWLNYAASVSPEQELALILARVGPVIAIGRPGERLPELGAARRYVSDDEWQEVIRGLITEAALVVIRAGDTPNLWWELEHAVRAAARRVVIVALGPLPEFDRRFAQAFGVPRRGPQPRPWPAVHLLKLLFPLSQHMGRIISFDAHGLPHEDALRFHLTWTGFAFLAFRPYRDSLRAGFRAVFERLGVPWSAQRDQTTAVLLALFGGAFGLHHFYLGRRGRGWLYVAFCWLVIPMIAGWVDAVRLSLLDDSEFRHHVRIDVTAAVL